MGAHVKTYRIQSDRVLIGQIWASSDHQKK